MKKIYACLLGNWVCLNEDPDCVMGNYRKSPSLWYEENAVIFAPFNRTEEDTYYQQDYIEIFFKGKDYRIHPIFLQIVSE